jgi:dihydroorotate dehydrogenase electron transfer subunit
MLKQVYKLVKDFDGICQVSLETQLACGIGACLGCVVKGSDGTYKRVCKEGPVFNFKDLDWDSIALQF